MVAYCIGALKFGVKLLDECCCPPWMFLILACIALVMAPTQKLLVDFRDERVRMEAVILLPFLEAIDDGVDDGHGLLLRLMIEDSLDRLQEQPIRNACLSLSSLMVESASRTDKEQVGPFEGELMMIDQYHLLFPPHPVAETAHGLSSAAEEFNPLQLAQQDGKEGKINACKTIYAHYI